MTKRFAFIGAVIVVVITITVFFAVRTIGKTQITATPTLLVTAVEPTPAQPPSVETPKPVPSQVEKPVLLTHDPGGVLLIEDLSSLVVDPDGRGLFSAFGHVSEGLLVYAPGDGYVMSLVADKQLTLVFVTTIRDKDGGIWLHNVASTKISSPMGEYFPVGKGEIIGTTQGDRLPFFKDSSINFGFSFGDKLGAIVGKYDRPTTARAILLCGLNGMN